MLQCATGRRRPSTALIHDPRFDEPLLLNTALPLTGTTCGFYRDRWPVEGLPLTAKQMLGAARQFVCSRESSAAAGTGAGSRGPLDVCRRTQPAISTGFGSYAEADVGQAPGGS